MELKTARMTLLIDPHKKAAFERLCAQQDRTASQIVRQMIREYLAAHGVEYTAAGLADETEPETEPAPASPAAAGAQTRRAPRAAAGAKPAPRASPRRR